MSYNGREHSAMVRNSFKYLLSSIFICFKKSSQSLLLNFLVKCLLFLTVIKNKQDLFLNYFRRNFEICHCITCCIWDYFCTCAWIENSFLLSLSILWKGIFKSSCKRNYRQLGFLKISWFPSEIISVQCSWKSLNREFFLAM